MQLMYYLKTVLLSLAVIVLVSSPCLAEQKDFKVYDPKKSLIIPEYRIKSRPDGSYAIFEKDQFVIPRWIVKDGKTYDPSKSLIIPQKNIKPWAPSGK